MKCVICDNLIPVKDGWANGNNAQPISVGRCCDSCNLQIVVPARLSYLNKN